jgi:hypothetical protein
MTEYESNGNEFYDESNPLIEEENNEPKYILQNDGLTISKK